MLVWAACDPLLLTWLVLLQTQVLLKIQVLLVTAASRHFLGRSHRLPSPNIWIPCVVFSNLNTRISFPFTHWVPAALPAVLPSAAA